VPLCAGVLALAALAHPPILRRPARLLDAALLLCLAGVAVQLMPLPAAVRDRLSPHGFAVDRVVALGAAPAVHPPHPLSVDAESTAWALALGAACIGLFWCARAIFSRGGVRATVRGVASLGLGLTVLVAVQRATSPELLYWTWRPLSAGASPYGPFVNRNSLATWLAMALPLVVGYAIARHESSRRRDGGPMPMDAIDATQVWLVGAAVLMCGGLLASLSRAGILGGGVGLLALLALSRRRLRRGGGIAWIAGALAAMVVIGSAAWRCACRKPPSRANGAARRSGATRGG
jgi:hypothetical protein